MFDYFRRRTAIPDNQVSDLDRQLIAMMRGTKSIVTNLYEDQDQQSLLMLAGAVFSLHQDTLRAFDIDMYKTDDVSLGKTVDMIRPNALGPFPERVVIVMKMMTAINNKNLDIIEGGRLSHMTPEEWQLHSIWAGLKATAARIWLLTMHSRFSDQAVLKLGVGTIWTALESVTVDELLRDAKLFTGTYYKDVRSGDMNLNHWPMQ